jgi:hypothetical protein
MQASRHDLSPTSSDQRDEKVKYYQYSTFVKTQDGKIYNIGDRDFPPTHHHGKDGRGICPECFVVNAWTEIVKEV